MIFKRKRRRIPYDAPGSRSRKKAAKAANRRADQVFLTRRVLMLKSVAVAGFTGLAARLGYMQIIHGDRWSAQAVSNVQRWRELKPARGMILDRQGRSLAVNRKTWSVSVIPNDLPELDTPEWDYLRGQLVTALRLPDVVLVDPRSIPVEARDQVYRRLGQLLGDTTDADYRQTVLNITQQLKYNPYAIFKDVGDKPVAMIDEYRSELPGITVVSWLDYLVNNYSGYETPILVKGDINRDVAMKLAANALYLPGVELDDQALTRVYQGGLSMSHVLGFAGPVTEEELKIGGNLVSEDEHGQPIYRYYKPGDIIGKQGLEGYYEEQLRGLKGGYLYETDGTGREVRQIEGHYQPAVPGRNIRLTIDTELQSAVAAVLADELPKAMERRVAADERTGTNWLEVAGGEHTTKGAAVVISDVASGEVLSMVSHPSYDNQLFVDGISNRKYQELTKDPQDPLFDKSFMGRYPPGSTIKPYMALTGLREGAIAPDTKFACRGGIKVLLTSDESKGKEYKCWNVAGTHGALTLESAIYQSCDVFFYNVGVPKGQETESSGLNQYFDYMPKTDTIGEEHTFQGLGWAKVHSALTKRFWFNKATGIDLPLENDGFVGDDEWKRDNWEGQGWSLGDTVNGSIGQGFVEASPLQMAVNVASLANGGTVYKPRVVRSIVDDKGVELQRFASVVKRKVRIDSNHLSLVLGAMKRVVHDEGGTAAFTTLPDGSKVSKWLNTNPKDEKEILIAGKTGTAEFGKQHPTKKLDDGSPDSFTDSHAWFTCFAPFDKPEVAIAVFIESGGEGSSNAVPIADKALRAYFETTGRRERGLMLRRDKQPVGEGILAPWQDGYKKGDDKPATTGGATPEAGDAPADDPGTPPADAPAPAVDEE